MVHKKSRRKSKKLKQDHKPTSAEATATITILCHLPPTTKARSRQEARIILCTYQFFLHDLLSNKYSTEVAAATQPIKNPSTMKLVSVFYLLCSAVMATDDTTTISHENCDANALPAENTSVSTLNNGHFYKMCPGSHQYSNNGKFATFGQPRCGDGSNFAFYLTRPEQPQEEEKILIELSGGGACWDKTTCTLQSSLLKMPPFDFMLGMSCSDMGKIAQASEGWDILCARTVGQTDFTEYTTVVLPYCTQDVHLGDAEATYDKTNVKHVGAHNTYRTLQWVFDNFEDPSHIVLTGCSAGATPLPVVYHMINEHYKARGRNVEIDIIADSPVSVFLFVDICP